MYKLIEHISDLLFLHDCVIIPDFGGFICNHKCAYIDESNGKICPPTKDILFNRNLVHNDGLLVNWIAFKENITYEKASVQLALFCEELKIKLNQKQRIAFGDIGVFYTDRRFNIIFEPTKNNFFADAYGMEALDLPQQEITSSNSKEPYINMESSGNFLHRFLKYGLAAAAIAGVAVITQLDIFPKATEKISKITNTSTIQPELPILSTKSVSGKVSCNSVISPDHDYVDYDPINDLKW